MVSSITVERPAKELDMTLEDTTERIIVEALRKAHGLPEETTIICDMNNVLYLVCPTLNIHYTTP